MVMKTAPRMLAKERMERYETLRIVRGRVQIREMRKPQSVYTIVQVPWEVVTLSMMEKVRMWEPMMKTVGF